MVEYFRLRCNNWIGGTRHLSVEQRSIYFDLICLYHDLDGHLPDDDQAITKLLRVDIRIWRRVKRELIEDVKKLRVVDGLLLPRNADESLKSVHAVSPKAAQKAKDRADVHLYFPCTSGGDHQDVQRTSPGSTRKVFCNPLKTNDSEKKVHPIKGNKVDGKKINKKTAPKTGALSVFELWWKRDVRIKRGKGRAKKAFLRALQKTTFDTIRQAWKAYEHREIDIKKTSPRYIQHPATWLNSEGWLDWEETAGPEKRTLAKPPPTGLMFDE